MYTPSLFSKSRTKSNPSASMCFAMVSWTLSGVIPADEGARVGFIRDSFRAGWRSFGIELDPALFLGGREDDERPRLTHSPDRVQLLDQQSPEGGHVLDPHLEQEGELAGYVMAFENLVQVPDRFDETGFEFRMFDEYLDERGDVLTQLPLVQECHIASDHPRALELPDALVDRWSGESDRLGKLGLGELGVILNQGQQFSIDEVEIGSVFVFC